MRSASARKNASLTSALSRACVGSRPSCRGHRLTMAAVCVVRRAGALCRYHCGAQWIGRCASIAERGTIVRLLEAAQDLSADALARLARLDSADVEALLGVVVAELVAEAQSRLRYGSD